MKGKVFYLFLFLLSVVFYLTNVFSYPALSAFVSFINSNFLPILEFKHQVSRKAKDLVNTYVFLVGVQKENKKLLEEVNQLSLKVGELETCKRELSQIKEIREFSWEPNYVVASIIAYDPSGRDEFIILDRGKKDDLEEGFVVVNRNTFVGIIDQVHASSSRVRTVWSETLSVSAIVNGKSYIYKGGFPTGRLLHVLQEDNINQGDRVLLRSPNFPSLEIGKVYGQPTFEEQFFRRIEVKPTADVRRMEFVTILRRRL